MPSIEPCNDVQLVAGGDKIKVSCSGIHGREFEWLGACSVSGNTITGELAMRPDATEIILSLGPGNGQDPILKRQAIFVFRSDSNEEQTLRQIIEEQLRSKEQRRNYERFAVVGKPAAVGYRIKESGGNKKSASMKKITITTESNCRISGELLRYGYRMGSVDISYGFPEVIPAGSFEWPQIFVPQNAGVSLFPDKQAAGKVSVACLGKPSLLKRIIGRR